LNEQGYENVNVARNSEQCMGQLKKNDIIILDHWLVEENGIDLLRKIKSEAPDTPVIFLSGQEFITIAIKSLKYGAFDYIEKSKLNIDRLVQLINLAIDHQNQIQKLKRLDYVKRMFSFGLL
jgi:DNA-binding NtrC family response regulator